MIQRTNSVKLSENLSKVIPDRSLFLDIETTGFSRKYGKIYLIGYLSKIDGSYEFRQLMTQSQGDEKPLLETWAKIVQDYKYIYSFNGQSFDIPFILERAKKYRIDISLDHLVSVDILRDIKSRSFLLDLGNYKLKTIEEFLGIKRQDQFSGKDLISLYYQYESSPNKALEEVLLLHNREDILNLPRLLIIYQILDKKNSITIGSDSFILDQIKLTQGGLEILGRSSIDRAYLTYQAYDLKIDKANFILNGPVHLADYDHGIKCIYVENQDLPLTSSYDYPAPSDIYLLKVGKEVLYKNIFDLTQAILDRIFEDL